MVLSSAGFSTVPALAKTAYGTGPNALGIMTVRFTIASILLLAARQVLSHSAPWPSAKIILQMLALGFFGLMAVSFTYLLAIRDIDTGLAIVIWYCNPLFVVLASWVLYKKRPSPGIILSLCFTLTGIYITVGQIKGAPPSAITLVLVSAVLFAGYLLSVAHVLKQVGVLTGVAIINVGTALGYWVVCLIRPWSLSPVFPHSAKSWWIILALTLFGTVAPFMCSFAGLKRVGPSLLSIITTIEPIFAISIGIIFLHEQLTLNRVIGAGFVIGALISVSVLESRTASVPVHQ